jgi:N-acetylglucosamine-6-phosphate deacetylase
MHLEGPWLSTTGKKKGKVKFRNAEEARKARELDEAWKQLQKTWAVEAEDKKRRRALEAAPLVYTLSGRETTRIASRDTGHTGAVRTKDIPKYTGTKIKGIGTMHKSNAVPIFSDEEAVAISQMRR